MVVVEAYLVFLAAVFVYEVRHSNLLEKSRFKSGRSFNARTISESRSSNGHRTPLPSNNLIDCAIHDPTIFTAS